MAATFQILALENMQNFDISKTTIVFFTVSEKIGVGLYFVGRACRGRATRAQNIFEDVWGQRYCVEECVGIILGARCFLPFLTDDLG